VRGWVIEWKVALLNTKSRRKKKKKKRNLDQRHPKGEKKDQGKRSPGEERDQSKEKKDGKGKITIQWFGATLRTKEKRDSRARRSLTGRHIFPGGLHGGTSQEKSKTFTKGGQCGYHL